MAKATTTIRIALEGAKKVEAELVSIGTQGDAALKKLRGVMGTLNGELGRTATQTRAANAGVKSLAQAYDDLGGSAQRLAGRMTVLQTALAAIVGTLSGRAMADAAFDLEGLRRGLEAATGGAQQAAAANEFLRETANAMGVSFFDTTRSYIGFRAAVEGTSISVAEAERIFKATSASAVVLGINNDRLGRIFNALQQIASKGTVQMEELKSQLGDNLPGALQMAADAMGVALPEFFKMVEAGEVLSEDFLPKFATILEQRFGSKLEDALATPLGKARKEMQQLGDTLKTLSAAAGEGFLEGVVGSVERLNDDLPTLIGGVRALSSAFGSMVGFLADAARLLGAIPAKIAEIGSVAAGNGGAGGLLGMTPMRQLNRFGQGQGVGVAPGFLFGDQRGAERQTSGLLFDTPALRAVRAADASRRSPAAASIADTGKAAKEAYDDLAAFNRALGEVRLKLFEADQEAGKRVFEETRTDVERLNAEAERLTGLFNRDVISLETFERAIKPVREELRLLTADMIDLINIPGFAEINSAFQMIPPPDPTDWYAVFEDVADAAKITAKDIQTAFSNAMNGAGDALTDFVLGGKSSFTDLANSIIRDLIRIAVQQSVVAPIAQALSGIFGGFFSPGGGGASIGKTIPSGKVGHTGGMAEALPGTRAVDPIIFQNAPRFHNGGFPGLARDEIPAILQTGERVLNRRETAAYNAGMNRGGANVQVIVNTPPGMSARTREEQSDDGRKVYVDIEEVVARSITSPKVRQQMANSYGLRAFPGAR